MFILCILIVLIAAWQFHERADLQESPTESIQGSKDEITPTPGKDETETGKDINLKVFDILGRSDNLNQQQWIDMQQWRNDAKNAAMKNAGEVFINGNGKKRQVALTFDDGPDETITPEVLDVLKQYQVQATFFLKANQLNTYRDLIRRMYAEGNEVASHAYSHQELNKMTAEDIDKEIIASDQAFARVIGVAPAMIRPPFGAINQNVLDVCQQEQEKIILWSIDTLDWSQPESAHITQNVLNNVRPGEIILMHSCKDREATVQALPLIIEGLRDQGYQIVVLSELLQIPAYKKE